MGGCASKPKEIDFAPCEAPTIPKSNHKNNNINKAPLVDHSEPKNKTVDAEPEPKIEKKFELAMVDDVEPAFARPAKAEIENKFIEEANVDQNVKEIGRKVAENVENIVKENEKKIELTNDQKAATDTEPAFARQAVEKKVETTELEPKTEKKFEVAVVDDAKPIFARPTKMETENKFIEEANADQNVKEIGKKVEGNIENVKESEKKIELTNYEKAVINAEPAFARQAVNKKVETTKELEKKVEVDIKAKESEKKVDDELVFAWPVKTSKANATKENENKVEDVVVPEIKTAVILEKVKEIEKKDRGVGEKAKEIEKVEGLAKKAEESAKTIEKKVEAKATTKEIEKKVEAAAIPSKAKEREKNAEKKVEAEAIAKEMEKKVEVAVLGKVDKKDEVPQKSEKLDQK